MVFHPNNTHRQFLSDVLNGFAEAGITLKRVEPEEFQQAVDRMMDNPDLVTIYTIRHDCLFISYLAKW